MTTRRTHDELLLELAELQLRLQEAEETLEAIRSGGVDALVVATPQGERQLFTLEGADRVYRVFLESMTEGGLTLSEDGLVLYANAAAARLLGAVTGIVTGSDLRRWVRRDERARFDALFKAGLRGQASAEIRLRGRRGGRPVRVSLRPVEDRGETLVVAVVSDLLEQKRTEKVLEAERLARSVLDQAGEAIIVCDAQGTVIRASRSAADLVGRDPLFEKLENVLPLRTTDGRPWPPLKRPSRSGSIRHLEARLDRPDGHSFRLLLSINPLRAGDEGVIGTVITLSDVTRLKEAEEAREELLGELRRANAELAAVESLSFAGLRLANVEQVAHAIVSSMATTMAADQATLLLADGSDLRLAARVPPDPPRELTVPIGAGFAGTIAKLRRTLVVPDVSASRRVRPAEVGRHVRSLLGVPLLFGGELIGVLHVGWRERHESDDGQQRFMQIIAERAATAISAQMLTRDLREQRLAAEASASENARLYQEQQRIATTLQENFIHPLPVIQGVDLGAVSQPAGEPELVGGDLSDVFAVDDRHVVVLIGDVAGKGVRAAGLTETVRSSVRALALIDPSPAFILAKANQLLLRRGPGEALVTAFCAVLDPTTGHVGYASAGHPPPVHLGEFSCQLLAGTNGPPLGTWEFPFSNGHVTLTLEDYLIFYTDGVTEARRDGEFFDEERLLEAVCACGGMSAQEMAEAVRDAAVDFAGELRDDIEVVALRLT